MKTGFKRFAAMALAVSLWACLAGCSSSNSYDGVHDPDGYLGYSDEFWEWSWNN